MDNLKFDKKTLESVVDVYLHLARSFPSLKNLIQNNQCLPYSIDFGNGKIIYMIDFTRKIDPNYDTYKAQCERSFYESRQKGMFRDDLGTC